MMRAGILPLAAGGQIGLSQPGEHIGGKARAVVADLDAQGVCRHLGPQLHLRSGKVDGILHQGRQAVQHLRQAANLQRRAALHLTAQGDALHAVGFGHFLQQVDDRQPRVVGVLRIRRAGQAHQDVPAALALFRQQLQVLPQGRGLGVVPEQLPGHHLQGGQGRAQLVGGGGGQPAEGRQTLLPRQHGLGGGQRQLHPRRLRRDLPGIGGIETDAGHRGRPHAEAVEPQRREDFAREPGQGQGEEEQGRHAHGGQQAERRGAAGRQGGGSHRHRCHQHQDEGVGEAAGQADQHRHLDQVEAQLEHRFPPPRQPSGGGGQLQGQVHPAGEGEHHQARAQGQGEVQAQRHPQNRGQLGEEGHPAQDDQRPQPQAATRLGPVPQVSVRDAQPLKPGRTRLNGLIAAGRSRRPEVAEGSGQGHDSVSPGSLL